MKSLDGGGHRELVVRGSEGRLLSRQPDRRAAVLVSGWLGPGRANGMNTSSSHETTDQTNRQNRAESIDETVTTTDGDDTGVRENYPLEHPVGVEDPSRRADGSIAPDDASTRAWRRERSKRSNDAVDPLIAPD